MMTVVINGTTGIDTGTGSLIAASTTTPTYLDLFEDTDNGSNYVRLIAPTSIASNRTITLPDNTGTILTTGSAGAVLQVVTFKYTTGQTFSSITALNYQDTGLTASITPSSASNKVLALVTASHAGPSSGNIGSTLALKRVSTRIAEGVGNHTPATNGEVDTPTGNIIVLDSPASTSSVAYTVQIAPRSSTATIYFNRNYAVASGFDAFITLMEIAA